MEIYDIKAKKLLKSFQEPSKEQPLFIVATSNEVEHLLTELNIDVSPISKSLSAEIRFETHKKFDYLNFVYYELVKDQFVFENFNLVLAKDYLLFVADENAGLYQPFIKTLFDEVLFQDYIENTLVSLYYQFLNQSFRKMFEAIFAYETFISYIEDTILVEDNHMDLSDIVDMKNESLEVKKYNRQLLYVGDQILLNDNMFFKKKEMRYLHNIDAKINKLYEYSLNVHEMASHLMEIYNTSVTSRTNDLINKLTIFTVFATPLTVITGLYGMNFKYMPELSHPYGYYIVIAVMLVTVLIIYAVLKKMKLL